MSCYPRRGDPKKHSGNERDRESEAEHRERGRGLDRQIAFTCNQVNDQPCACIGDSNTDKTTKYCENNAFGESLTNEIAAGRAKSGADRDLGLARRSTYEHEIGEVGASN